MPSPVIFFPCAALGVVQIKRGQQDAFGERSVEALKGALATMTPEDAQYHMKRCVDSGLWDPAGAGGGGDDDDDAPADVSDAGAGSSSADAAPSKKSAEVDD